MSPAESAAEALGIAVTAVTDVMPIKHGLTNESWLVRTDSDAVVVRLGNIAEDELQIDRASEAAILDAVARVGIGADVLLNDRARRVLVTRYLGPAWTHEEALRERNVERIARLLQRLHEMTPPPGAHRVDLAASIAGYLDILATRRAESVLTIEGARRRAQDAIAALGASPVCLCHNDVHHLNVVDDGSLHLIDWEYAGIGEPLFDLASVCVYHRYNDVRTERLLGSYLGFVDRAVWEQLEEAKWLFGYVRDLWLAVRESVA
jgi:thiamine kinase-like enzyme